jgi:xanthine dehydrogenase large subunit
MPPLAGELHVGIVGSPVAHGTLTHVETDSAMKLRGVVAILSACDIPGHNLFGPIFADEVLLAHDELTYVGQPVVLIAAESRAALSAAKKLIKIEADELPPILTIDEAIAQSSYLSEERVIARGDVENELTRSPHQISGELCIGGQEHFYLESQASLVIPGENGTLTVYSSTQHPSEVQATVAEICNLPFNAVTVITPRMGGGFGGKETQGGHFAAMAALVAVKTGRPARIVLDRDTDMAITGKRHDYKSLYKLGFDDTGKILAWDVQLFSNGGCTTDLSFAVFERSQLHSDNAYFIPHFRARGRVCKTHLPSNTAFRGFGGPQGVMGIENAIQEMAAYLRRDPYGLRQLNCYGVDANNVTPYGQVVRNNILPKLLNELRASSNYDERCEQVEKFNRCSKTHLRGIAMTPIKFGISFTKQHMNQANALVNIYNDGTVLVSTGGTEMGQGVNTRVRQIVADELGVDYNSIRVTATNTDKNNNTSPTAASAGTDLNGAAAIDACSRLKSRLAQFATEYFAKTVHSSQKDFSNLAPDEIIFENGWVFCKRDPSQKLEFKKIAKEAYFQRVSLGERGFYATPGVDFDRDAGRGTPFLYYTNGAAVSEVLIDRFTGEMKVTRADILMDLGKSINPALDRGQITGGFIQGMGWCTAEELKYSAKGELLSHSPTTYKIPNISDTPEDFRIALFDNPDSEVSIKRSKAAGEPPLMLGISVWAAVKDALTRFANRDAAIADGNTYGEVVSLALPATSEEILLALTRLQQFSHGQQQSDLSNIQTKSM